MSNSIKPAALILLIVLAAAVAACNGSPVVNESDGGNSAAISSNANSNGVVAGAASPVGTQPQSLMYTLPAPRTDGETSVEEALASRRSHRQFEQTALSQEQISQILWSAYGVTYPGEGAFQRGGLRTAPSAGALYPLEIYIVIGNVDGIDPGVYKYISEDNIIELVVAGDIREELADAALGQTMVRDAPATVFFSAVFERTTERYGQRGTSFVYIEVGHSAQNVYLQAEALGFGTCAIGAFTADRVRELLNLPENEEPLYLMPVGHKG